ncbi:hypothetical protein JTB14_032670 [Gonioctena quinquepunctata]|nr:hypothetical protein JTB14_032670 [Gonioctena quinquepunctata]
MGDVGQFVKKNSVEGSSQTNQDELILAQQRQIEKEISETTALVGDLEPITSLNEDSKDVLVSLGFQQFTVEDFYDTYMDVLKRLKVIEDVTEARNELHTLFNEQGFSDYMVVYLRLLTSGQLQKDQDFYSCFIEGDRTVADFCHQEVEPMYKESDHIHIIAACAAVHTGCKGCVHG